MSKILKEKKQGVLTCDDIIHEAMQVYIYTFVEAQSDLVYSACACLPCQCLDLIIYLITCHTELSHVIFLTLQWACIGLSVCMQ